MQDLRSRLKALLPDHLEVVSYGMPGFRKPKPNGKMVIGYAAFVQYLGIYPHAGSVIPHLDFAGFKTSKSGVLFTAGHPLPQALQEAIIHARQADLTAGYGAKA